MRISNSEPQQVILEELHTTDRLKRKRIGLFGGTFDPIHVGHLQAVRDVQRHFLLDNIYLIPSAQPPHKTPNAVADAEDRLEMIRLAISNHPDFLVSDVELKRSGPSYTIDTVVYFKSNLSNETEIFLIMGLDAFLEIDTWKSYKRLFSLIPFIVMARPCFGGNLEWKPLEDYLRSTISPDYKVFESKQSYISTKTQPVFRFDGNPREVSSTQIRNLVKKGGTIDDLVDENVKKFIQLKGLYK